MIKRVYFWEDRGDKDDRVISAKRVAGGIQLREECDRYFSVVLTNQELEGFIAKLREVAAQPEPADGPTA